MSGSMLLPLSIAAWHVDSHSSPHAEKSVISSTNRQALTGRLPKSE